MGEKERKWMVVGIALILALSSTIMFAGSPRLYAPMPIYMLLMAWVISVAYVAVMPILFAIQFKRYHSHPKYGIGLMVAVLVISVLDIWWFVTAWDYGLKWQGLDYTKLVALENIIGFSLLLLLTSWAVNKGNKSGLYAANIGLFILLTWCAFPSLGELP